MGKYSDLLMQVDAIDGLPSWVWRKAGSKAAPAAQPAPSAAPSAAPAPVQAQPQPKSYSRDLLDPTPMQAPQTAPEPAQEGWGEWMRNSIQGRQDPREANTGTVYEQFKPELTSPTATGAMLGTNDAGMGDIISKSLGDKFVRREQDANGYEIIVTRGPDGQEQRGYVNKPGLDTQDAWRAFYGAAPYVATGGAVGAATKGAGLGVQMLGQGVAAGATKLAGDVAALGAGSEQSPDIMGAGVMAGFGAAGPVVGATGGALWRKFVTIPGLVDKSTGQLTARGLEAAKKAGIDPADITPDFAQGFAKSLAESKNPAQAAVKAGGEQYGIPATKGQMMKDPYLLTQEEGMRRRLYGEQAQNTMRGFDANQMAATREAALGPDQWGGTGARNVAGEIAPGRKAGSIPSERMSSTLGNSIQDSAIAAREAARKAEGVAWEGTDLLETTPEALKSLPDMLNAKLGGMMPNATVTPVAAQMAKEVDRIIAGEAPEKAASWLAASPSKNIEQIRRSLLEMSKSAAPGSDTKMAGRIYDGFNDWIADAAEKKLLSGDPEAALKIVKARGFTREVRQVFEPKDARGQLSPAGARLAKVLDPARTDSGEAVIQALMGSEGSRGVNNGTVQALQSLKTALTKYAPDEAASAWGDIGLAHWSRLVTGKNGEMLGPMAVSNNIKAAMQSQQSLMKTLYTPQQLREIRNFGRAVEAIAYKPPNASGSGYTAASFIKDGLLKVLESFGLGKVGNAALNYTGIGNAWNAAGARSAVSQTVRPVRPNLTPLTAGTGQAYERSR